MKKLLIIALQTLWIAPIFAQTQVKVSINAATVFLSGAELSSSANVNLPQGETEVLFTNVAGNVNQQSLTIGAENGVVIESSTFQNDFLGDKNLSPIAKMLQDSIAFLEKENGNLEDKRAVIQEELAALKDNRKVSGNQNGLSVLELQKYLQLLNTQMNGLLTEQRNLSTKTDKGNERIALLKKQIEEEQQKGYQPGGQLLVKFYAPKATSSDINITYVVPNAGWTPAYDLRVDKINDPVNLFYKANIYQNSGVKWTNIKLSISTGNPNEGVNAPVLNPNYLAFYNPNNNLYKAKSLSMAGGRLGSSNAVIIDGVAMTSGVSAYNDKPKFEQTTLDDYTSVDNSGVNTTFDIDLPYTVPSDGKPHNIAIKTYTLPASYRYFTVPKLDHDAFLQAQITNWEDLNLLPAITNIFFEGTYVGQGTIDMRNVHDTMNISLGRDKKIVIRRERDKSLHSIKTIGSNERQTFGYTISIRNTRKEAIHLVVLDQVPVSNDKDITIEDTETGNASYDETTGALRWTMDVKPSDLQKLQLGYTVKYPKGKTISNLQ